MYPTYAPIVANHLVNDLGKLTVATRLTIDEVAGTGTVNAVVKVAAGETISLPNECKIRCVIYENDITFCCDPRGNDHWNAIARDALPETPLTISNSGEIQNFDRGFTINAGWNRNNLHAVVYVQRDTNKRILNAGADLLAFDIELESLDPVAQTLSGTPAPIEWDQHLWYTGWDSDAVDVTIDKSGLPAGWSAELVYNSTTYPDGFSIPAMATYDEDAFVVRILPSGPPALGKVEVRAEPVSQPEMGESLELAAFWNLPAILLVDDDGGASNETVFESAIADAGYASITHSVSVSNTPTANYLNIFDAVIWTTGSPETDTIGAEAENELRSYLDQGGRLFLSSQGFTDDRTFNVLSINYLKVASYTLDQGATVGNGLAGDVIGDGLALTLVPPFPDKADRINPNTGAVAWLRNQLNNPVALRYDGGVFKTVFMAAPFEGIPLVATASDPNNQKTVMKRILDWFIPPAATDVNPGTGAATAIALAQNAPNPFSSTTSLSFALPKSGPVSLSVYDVSGRLVSTLVNRPMDAGNHQVVWDGRDSGGNMVANGVYMLRLQAGGETLTRDMVRMK
jgi:hypothetical protein